jgi:hypothetical protein
MIDGFGGVGMFSMGMDCVSSSVGLGEEISGSPYNWLRVFEKGQICL